MASSREVGESQLFVFLSINHIHIWWLPRARTEAETMEGYLLSHFSLVFSQAYKPLIFLYSSEFGDDTTYGWAGSSYIWCQSRHCSPNFITGLLIKATTQLISLFSGGTRCINLMIRINQYPIAEIPFIIKAINASSVLVQSPKRLGEFMRLLRVVVWSWLCLCSLTPAMDKLWTILPLWHFWYLTSLWPQVLHKKPRAFFRSHVLVE